MLKKMMIVASMAIAAAAFAIPGVASANWTDAGAKVAGEKNVTFEGPASFVGLIGGVECIGHSNTTLTGTGTPGNGTTGDVTSFSVANPAGCTTSGGLKPCTVTSVTSNKLPWTAHTTTATIEITGVDITNTLHGAFCPYHELQLKGTVTATPDILTGAKTVTLSSTPTTGKPEEGNHVPAGLEAYNGTTGVTIQPVSAGGILAVTPSGTYGIK